MISALYRVIVPSSSATVVPGSRVRRVWARSIRTSARSRDSPSAYATWLAVNSPSGGRGCGGPAPRPRRACGRRRGPRPGPMRIPPRSARPPRRRRTCRPHRRQRPRRPPGPRSRQHVQRPSPGRTRPPGWTTGRGRPAGSRTGRVRAARSWPPRRPAAHRPQPPGSPRVPRGERLEVPVLVPSSSRWPSSCSHTRSRPASSSAAVIGSRSSQARSSSRPGSAGAGDAGMDHLRSGGKGDCFIKHNSGFCHDHQCIH